MYEVFVSYASADQVAADRLVAALEKRGLSCWISSREIPAGGNFQVAIPAAIEAASVIVLLYSRQVLNSVEVPRELALASQFKKSIVPLRLEKLELVDPFRWYFTTAQYVDIWDDFDEQLNRLCKRLGEQCDMAHEVARKTDVAARWSRARSWSLRTGLVAAACVGAVMSWRMAPKLHALENTTTIAAAPLVEHNSAVTDMPLESSTNLAAQPTMALALSEPAPVGVEPEANSIEAAARQFALKYYAMVQGQPAAMLSYLGSVATDPVHFYGQNISRSRVIGIQRAYLSRWPDRHITVRPSSWSIACDHQRGSCDVAGIYDYILHNNARHLGASGAERFSISTGSFSHTLSGISSTSISRHAFDTGDAGSMTQHASLQGPASAN